MLWRHSQRCFHRSIEQHQEQFMKSISAGGSVLAATPRIARAARAVTPRSSVLVALVRTGSTSANARSEDSTGKACSDLSVLLTKRSALLKAHRGEVCFPGGKMDEGETLEQTALRETCEETGLPASAFKIWAPLEPVLTSRFDRAVTPIVAHLEDASHLQKLHPNFDEVDSIFSVPVSSLLSSVSSTLFVSPKYQYRLPVFRCRSYNLHAHAEHSFIPREYRVWGLSAIILHQLLCHLEPEGYDRFKVQFY